MVGCFSLCSQESADKEFTKAFHNADNYFYYDENYVTAASLYEPLYKTHPDNSNLAAKLGICYLNIEDKKSEALELLIKASKNYAAKASDYVQTGSKAPHNVMLYLAIAYHRNDSLDKALSIYNELKKELTPDQTTQEEFLDLQIRDCKYAIEMKKKPLRIISDLFAPWLSKFPGSSNPVLAKNDSVFVFLVKNGNSTQVYCSYKNKTWQYPSNITKQLGGFDRLYTNSITGNGKLLVMYMDDGGDGNLYYSVRTDTTWTKIRSLGKNINTIYWESFGFITPDGKNMFFSSNRPGGEGELDIWESQRAADGSWGKAINLGNVINTPYDEDTPYYDTDNDALIFSSTGHISMGGSDILRSTNRNGLWTQPVGMPYAFNDVQDNKDFILNNGAPGFIASRFDNNSNSRNIYAIVAVDPADEITTASGIIKLEDGMDVNPNLALITVKNLKTGAINQNIGIAADGSFKFDIKPGDYQVLVSHDNYTTDTINLNLPLYFNGKYLSVNPLLKPERVASGAFLSIRNVLFDFDSYILSEDAKQSLGEVKNILIESPGLTVEVAGYTDSKGSSEYNKKLAGNRAQAVIDYMTSGGIESTLFVKKAFGESHFAAMNTNPDGSDNPEGRKYNRRVTFGIVDPQSGVIIRHETYTPEYLRQPSAIKYSVVLEKSAKILTPDYFKDFIKDDYLFIKTIKTDSAYLYLLGMFYNREDALKYLQYSKEKGFKDAYIINEYDLENKTPVYNEKQGDSVSSAHSKVITIQMKATKSPVNIDKVFKGFKGVKEVLTDDGYYKYYYGEFTSLEKAKEALKSIKKDFEDAFIRELTIP
jgi:outer membrane protein OmpA-like peptidoglycan-associated protein